MAENERPPYWLQVEHNMLRRNQSNNYHSGHKAYMVTLRIQDMVPLLSEVVESSNPDEVAHCRLTTLGEAMRQAWLTLPQRFPNISIKDSPDEYVIMPEHFHGIILSPVTCKSTSARSSASSKRRMVESFFRCKYT